MKKALFLSLVFLLSQPLFSQETVLQKVILQSENYPGNSPEQIVVHEIRSALEILDSQNELIFYKEEKWDNQRNLLIDLNSQQRLSTFFLRTDVRGVIAFDYSPINNTDSVKVSLIKIVEQETIVKEYLLRVNSLIEDAKRLRAALIEDIRAVFQPVSQEDILKQKLEQRTLARENPDYEFLFSAGTGFFSRTNLEGEALWAPGITLYLNLDTKIKALRLQSHFEYDSQILTRELTSEDFIESPYAGHLALEFYIGGLFYGEMFQLGGGVGFMQGSLYHLNRRDDSDSSPVYRVDYYLLTLGLRLSVMPTRASEITLTASGFLSPGESLGKFGASPFFPVKLDFNFRFYLYRGLFLELAIPFYLFSYDAQGLYNENGGGSAPVFNTSINIGLGWRFEWREK